VRRLPRRSGEGQANFGSATANIEEVPAVSQEGRGLKRIPRKLRVPRLWVNFRFPWAKERKRLTPLRDFP
jgi:hypothetical protein